MWRKRAPPVLLSWKCPFWGGGNWAAKGSWGPGGPSTSGLLMALGRWALPVAAGQMPTGIEGLAKLPSHHLRARPLECPFPCPPCFWGVVSLEPARCLQPHVLGVWRTSGCPMRFGPLFKQPVQAREGPCIPGKSCIGPSQSMSLGAKLHTSEGVPGEQGGCCMSYACLHCSSAQSSCSWTGVRGGKSDLAIKTAHIFGFWP